MRIQLQATGRVYTSSFGTLATIWRNEGVAGLQRGLAPAIMREGTKNFFRIGAYDPLVRLLHPDQRVRVPAWKRLLAGSACGTLGYIHYAFSHPHRAFSCNPFELVKTRLQSATSSPALAHIAHQHQYTSTWHALRSIVQAEGVAGLYRGSGLSVCRSIVGSGTNLTVFTLAKEELMKRGWRDSKTLDVVCGMGSAVMSV